MYKRDSLRDFSAIVILSLVLGGLLGTGVLKVEGQRYEIELRQLR